MRNITKVGLCMSSERFSVRVLGERVSEHVICQAVDAADMSIFDAFPESMNPIIDVLRSVIGDGIFTHQTTSAIVLVERSGCLLRMTHTSNDAFHPDKLIRRTRRRNIFSLGSR